MVSSSSGSSRRARIPGDGSLVPSCLVDGCTADLGNCRDYHRRHKVCELHSKTSMVFIKGHEQRFCQQCSRFHSLVEFDEGKRSCRKRLEGHNRRRRKPHRASASANAPRSFTIGQDTRYIHFGATQIGSGAMISEPLTRIVKCEDHKEVYNSHHPSLSFSTSDRSLPDNNEGGKQFFLRGTSSTFPGSSTSHIDVGATSDMFDSHSSEELFSDDGLNRVFNSNRALSLLSSPPAETQGINRAQPEFNPQAQSSISSLNYSCTRVESEPVGSVLVSDSRNAQRHGQNATTGSQQTLSFSWK